MFWSEDNDAKKEFVVPDDVVDIAFKLECRTLPLDHAQALSAAIQERLSWFADEERAGLHLIHVAESGNGWYRPEDPENEVLCLSKRTRMSLRVPKHRIDDAHALTGEAMDIGGYELIVREGTVKPLSALPTMFARYVIAEEVQDEYAFLKRMATFLREMDIPVKKMMAGKQYRMNMDNGPVFTRSLMVADLAPEDAVKLQQEGIGSGRKFGCGLFMPQKGIKAVNADS
ncbi:MAG: type I-MYXAN CRISPR-associated protein Cas6/Cmx6 [Gammaproteobacteria bacterium]|nr:type I-MYXAN CRISPR-associated protein Cas6/Cmx6 [Gammaproteobacteria bacterium]